MKAVLKVKRPIKIYSNSGKLIVNGEKIALSDIVAFRYDFEESSWVIGEGEYATINNDTFESIEFNRKYIDKSLHIVELHTHYKFNVAEMAFRLREKIPNIAIFVHAYYNGNEDDLEKELMYVASAHRVANLDRFMLHDNTDCLTIKFASELLKYASAKTCIQQKDIGICDSPIGCSLGIGCLSAIKCRELSAKYGDSLDMVIPSKNNESASQNNQRACSCVYSIVVDSLKAYTQPVKDNDETKKKVADLNTKTDSKTVKKTATKKKNCVMRWGGL